MRPGTVVRVEWIDQTLEVSHLHELTVVQLSGSFVQFYAEDAKFWVPLAAIKEWVEIEPIGKTPTQAVGRIQLAIPQFRALVDDAALMA